MPWIAIFVVIFAADLLAKVVISLCTKEKPKPIEVSHKEVIPEEDRCHWCGLGMVEWCPKDEGDHAPNQNPDQYLVCVNCTASRRRDKKQPEEL